MSAPRIRIQSVVLVLILFPAAVGIVAVHASATCQRFVRSYVTTPVRNRVSKATAIAWAKWRTVHPNWKPNPKVQRPKYKYVMTRQEAVDKVDFACEVPLVPSVLDSLLASDDGPSLITEIPMADMSQTVFPDVVPPEVAEITPANLTPYTPPTTEFPVGPYIPPVLGGVPPPQNPLVPPVTPITDITPEPASWVLVASGMGIFGCLLYRRGIAV